MRIYIGILPPALITEQILNAREALGIEPIRNPPHLTLRSSFTTESYDALLEELATIRSPSFTITFDGYTVFDDTFLVLTAQKTPELMELERQVMLISQKHRVFEDKPLRRPLDAKPLEYLKTYGDPFVFELYTPHLTLAYKLPERVEVHEALQLPLEFTAREISIVEKPDYTVRDRMRLADP